MVRSRLFTREERSLRFVEQTDCWVCHLPVTSILIRGFEGTFVPYVFATVRNGILAD
jgi:hypothetical protein